MSNDECDYEDYDDEYYNDNYADDVYDDPVDNDPEYFEYKVFRFSDLSKNCQEKAEKLARIFEIKFIDAQELLKKFKWNYYKLIDLYETDKVSFKENLLCNDDNNNELVGTLNRVTSSSKTHRSDSEVCTICFEKKNSLESLECMHKYCQECWQIYFELSIEQSLTSQFECMHSKCKLIVNKDFVLKYLNDTKKIERYFKLISMDLIKNCDDLRHCPGVECDRVVWARPQAGRIQCDGCDTQFCFMCSYPYHAPNSCETIKKWHLKCQDDSETQNYILVHTRDCPACKVCIEKNGGCSHMTCNRCKHEFCWVCLQDWKSHGGTNAYDCNRYKPNPKQDEAREALQRYNHYYHRWINHNNSLKFEKAFREKYQQQIQDKIMNGLCGTLVDWEFLMEATNTLLTARYTLQYTYPYAYYLESNDTRFLFENIQAELERDVENLSHNLEKCNLDDKYLIKLQMSTIEKRRKTLIKDFFR
jgi:ariadne-2